MKEKIVSIITDYLNREETDYALMINGAWGSGKTFFIKNTLKSEIEKIDCHEGKKSDENRKYKLVYVSLYGISSIDEIKERIFYAINSSYKSVGFLLGKIGLFLENNSKGVVTKEDTDILKDKFTTYNDKVFFFDDLERIDQKKIDTNTVLGYINFLAEHEHYKIVVVANNEVLDEQYKQFQEKTIRFVCNYTPNFAEVFDDICKRYEGDYKQFIVEQKQSIVDVFRVGECDNIRTLIFITDLYQKIFEEVYKIGEDCSSEINRDLLLPFTIISIESKNGYSKDILKDNLLNSINNFNDLDFLLDDNQNISPGDTTSEEDSKKQDTDKELSFDKYKRLKNRLTIRFYDELYDWIYDGYVSQDRVCKFIETIIKDYVEKLENEKRKNAKKLSEKIMNWIILEDKELNDIINQININIAEGNYNVLDLLGIYAHFIQIDANIDGFNLTDEITDNFKSAIENIMKDEPYSPSLNNIFPLWNENGKYTELRNYTLKLNDKNKGKSPITKDELLNIIKDNKIEDLKDFMYNIDNKFFFMEFPIEEIISNVIKSNNEMKNAFLGGLTIFFPKELKSEFSERECHYLSEIKAKLNDYINNQMENKQTEKNIGYVNIERIIKYIDSITQRHS